MWIWWLLEKPVWEKQNKGRAGCLAAESVESTALALQSVDNVHGSDGLSLSVLRVGDSVTDDVLQEDLEDATGLLVDETTDSLHSTTASQATNSGLGDTLDVVTQDFPVALGASLSETFSSLATSRHDEIASSLLLED